MSRSPILFELAISPALVLAITEDFTILLGQPDDLHATLHPPAAQHTNFMLHIREGREQDRKKVPLLQFPERNMALLLEAAVVALRNVGFDALPLAPIEDFLSSGWRAGIFDPQSAEVRAILQSIFDRGRFEFEPEYLAGLAPILKVPLLPLESWEAASSDARIMIDQPNGRLRLQCVVRDNDHAFVIVPFEFDVQRLAEMWKAEFVRVLARHPQLHKLVRTLPSAGAALGNLVDRLPGKDG